MPTVEGGNKIAAIIALPVGLITALFLSLNTQPGLQQSCMCNPNRKEEEGEGR